MAPTSTSPKSYQGAINFKIKDLKQIPRFHPVGFQKVKIPSDIYARILNNRKKLINEKRKFQIERCDFGMQNCQKIVESRWISKTKT